MFSKVQFFKKPTKNNAKPLKNKSLWGFRGVFLKETIVLEFF